jgi:hypothetical protein
MCVIGSTGHASLECCHEHNSFHPWGFVREFAGCVSASASLGRVREQPGSSHVNDQVAP